MWFLFVIINVVCIVRSQCMVFDRIYVEYGNNLGDHVIHELQKHLNMLECPVQLFTNFSTVDSNVNSLIFGFGNSSLTNNYITQMELNNLPDESFILKSLLLTQSLSSSNTNKYQVIFVSNGNPLSNKLGITHTIYYYYLIHLYLMYMHTI